MALQNDGGIKKSIIKCVLISLSFGIIASIVFCINSSFIVKYCFHNKVSDIIVYLIAVALPMISVSSSISGYFTAVRRVYKTVVANFLEYSAKIIFTILLLKKYLPTANIENICFALILGDVLSEVVSFTYNIIVFTFDLEIHIDNNFKIMELKNSKDSYLKRIFRILMPISLTSYIKSGLSTIKQLIIPSSLEKNGLNSEKALADYGTITGMAMPIITFPSTVLYAIAGLLIPEFSRYYIKKDFIKIKLYTKKLIFLTIVFSIFVSIIFVVFGETIAFYIYHDKSIGIYIKIFSFIIPFMYVDIIVDGILKGLDAQVSVLFINILDLLISISFIFFFVPRFGIVGFIASIFVSEILNFVLSLSKLYKIERA